MKTLAYFCHNFPAFAVLIAFCCIGASCPDRDIPGPVVGSVRTETIGYAIPEPCVDLSKLDKRPKPHAAPAGSDGVRAMAGAKADAEDLAIYSKGLEAELLRCSSAPKQTQTPKEK